MVRGFMKAWKVVSSRLMKVFGLVTRVEKQCSSGFTPALKVGFV